MAKQIECSLDDCVIRMALIASLARAPKRRIAMPGTPTMPSPSRRSSATRGTEAMPRTSNALALGCAEIDRARERRVEGVLDDERDALGARRVDGGRIHDLGAEVRHLHQLVVGHRRDREGAADDARVGAHDAVDVGPDLDRGRVERGADQRGGVVGAAAAERRGFAGLGGGDEAGEHRDRVPARERLADARVALGRRTRAAPKRLSVRISDRVSKAAAAMPRARNAAATSGADSRSP